MRWLLLCVPAVLVLRWLDADPLLVFGLALAAVVPLVEIMGGATERLAVRFGPTVGGLLNATLANAPECIIGFTALRNGLASVVKASLTGSILVNLLVGLGCALVIGGLRFGTQRFDRTRLRSSAAMLLLCAFCFIVPAVFRSGSAGATRELSTEIAGVLLAVYVVNVLATLLGRGGEGLGPEQPPASPHGGIPLIRTLMELGGAAVALAVVSDALSEALQPTARQLGLSDLFSGIVLLGGVGGIGEVLAAIRFARAGRQELVLAVTVGSTIQMVLLVAPLLVLFSPLTGHPMNLAFTSFEVVAIVVAVIVTRELIDDGKVTWMEGVLMLATYVIFAFAFYHVPDGAAVAEQRAVDSGAEGPAAAEGSPAT
jgi:Ca2+:H+ antiporter